MTRRQSDQSITPVIPREVMVMENTNPMMGTCGTISWQLVEINMRLIIMWSVPFNFNIRDSYYAIGLTHNKVFFL